MKTQIQMEAHQAYGGTVAEQDSTVTVQRPAYSVRGTDMAGGQGGSRKDGEEKTGTVERSATEDKIPVDNWNYPK